MNVSQTRKTTSKMMMTYNYESYIMSNNNADVVTEKDRFKHINLSVIRSINKTSNRRISDWSDIRLGSYKLDKIQRSWIKLHNIYKKQKNNLTRLGLLSQTPVLEKSTFGAKQFWCLRLVKKILVFCIFHARSSSIKAV